MHTLLQIQFDYSDYKRGILAFVTAFIVALLTMIPLIKIIHRFHLFDVPDNRKEHSTPIPTMGGIASCIGMAVAVAIWYAFTNDVFTVCFFFSIATLFVVGIFDDLKNLSARYRLAIQLAVGALIAFSGVRLTSFNGLFGITELPISAQYTFT